MEAQERIAVVAAIQPPAPPGEMEQVCKKKKQKRGPGFTCLFCNKRFKGTSCEKTHIRRHINEKPYECGLCSFSAACLTDVSTHQRRTHSSIRLTCNVSGCNKVFKCEFARKRHYKLNHTEGVTTFLCEVCNKVFKQQANLVAHRMIHTGEKPFKCRICDREFNQKSNLTTHLSMHTGEKRAQCDICLKWFRKKNTMLCHREKRNCHSPVKPFSCTVCGVAFYQKSYLKDHYKLAHGVIKYGSNRAVVISHGDAASANRSPVKQKLSESCGAPANQSSVVNQNSSESCVNPTKEPPLNPNVVVSCVKALDSGIRRNQKIVVTGASTGESSEKAVVSSHAASPRNSSISQKIVVCRGGAAIVTTSKNPSINKASTASGSPQSMSFGRLQQVKQTLAQGHKTYVVIITKGQPG